MNILFLTPHILPGVARKSSVLLLAEKAAEHGDAVSVVTVGYSWISKFHDGMRGAAKREIPLNTWLTMAPQLETMVWRPIFHPANLRKPLLNAITTPLQALYPYLMPATLVQRIRAAHVIFVESSTALFLVRRLRKLAPEAKLVYIASDRLHVIHAHPALQTLLDGMESNFSLIRVHAEAQLADFKPTSRVVMIPQAITTDLLDTPSPTPYKSPKQAISVGDMLFEPWVIETLAEAFPDWTFHLFGNKARITKPLPNVEEHGETPLPKLIPFIQHAHVGLAPYRPEPDTDYLAQSSMKMAQYTYCKLPIVAPTFAQSATRPHVCGYMPGNRDSLLNAFRKAVAYDRRSITHTLKNWDDTWLWLRKEVEDSILKY
jgi:2-beta-glucuronyltransferase